MAATIKPAKYFSVKIALFARYVYFTSLCVPRDISSKKECILLANDASIRRELTTAPQKDSTAIGVLSELKEIIHTFTHAAKFVILTFAQIV